jgi:hypothetical protein
MPAFGPATVLLTHAGDLRGTGDDECPDCCPCRGSRHHHFQIDVGPGFLGALEQFGRDEEGSGVRAYRFVPRHRRGAPGPSLSAAGKSGSLVSAFIPALLGDPDACRRLSGAGHRLLQALVRETTRSRARSDDADGRAEVLEGNRLRSYSGRSSVACRLLDADGTYIGFNGNGKRRGMGYRLAGEWGWPARADYPHDALGDFLDDLAAAVEVLSLTVFGVGPGNECYSLLRLRALADSAAGRRELARIDVRAFAPADFAERWSAKFGWPLSHGEEQKRPELTVGVEMRSRGLSGRKLAKALGCDPSFFGKLLKGKKPWPPALLKKALGHLRGAKRNGARSSGMNSGRTSPS